MIAANELRIGNYILLDTGIDLPRWHCIKAKDIFDISEGKVTLNAINPLILSPEILEKCGFVGKYKSCGYAYKKDIVNLSSQDEDDYGNPIENYVLHFYHNHSGAPIYYLHQLQNLYYCLVGEELQVKL